MKHLFFVSVAIGIFSGTSISVKAQTSVNLMRMTGDVTEKNSPQFIEGIEIKPETPVSADRIIVNTATNKTPVKKSTTKDFGSSIETSTTLQFKYAQLMDVDVESLANMPLYNFIEEWWGTRYWYGGTGKKGIDCSAYSGALLGQVWGLKSPRTARAMYGVAEKISRDKLKEGDLVFFNTRGGVSHVGVYLGNGYFTHSSTHAGVTINNLDESYYSSKFISGGRLTASCEE